MSFSLCVIRWVIKNTSVRILIITEPSRQQNGHQVNTNNLQPPHNLPFSIALHRQIHLDCRHNTTFSLNKDVLMIWKRRARTWQRHNRQDFCCNFNFYKLWMSKTSSELVKRWSEVPDGKKQICNNITPTVWSLRHKNTYIYHTYTHVS